MISIHESFVYVNASPATQKGQMLRVSWVGQERQRKDKKLVFHKKGSMIFFYLKKKTHAYQFKSNYER